ncbi:MAG: hypothetical protein VZQ28_01425 [Methanomethylophilus sp.]|jgi:flavodoxin|nr:hypothetical protein [Methanomethylophilus sp.]WII08491.1 flavodoxin [Methanomassiliicoccales archaeon LGM-DZ1]
MGKDVNWLEERMVPLVAYFSIGGAVRRTAEMISAVMEADIIALDPESEWTKDPSNGYDTVIVGFPMVMFKEPEVVDRFLGACTLIGKTVCPFYVSGSIGNEGHVMPGIRKSARGASIMPVKWFVNDTPLEDVEAWTKAIAAFRAQALS